MKATGATALAAMLLLAPALAAAQIQSRPYLTGLSQPVGFLADPTSANRQFVVEQAGRIRVVVDGVVQPLDFLDIRDRVLFALNSERGLLGMALDPAYTANRRFYVFYTQQGSGTSLGGLVVARFTRSASNPAVADSGSGFVLKWIGLGGQGFIRHEQFGNHNGGCLAFGPDGYLYVGTGDGGGGNDPLNQAQSAASLLGKILRIDVNVPDTDPNGYRIPPDNPFLDNTPITALPETWAFGLRNPWRFTFDGAAMFIADVGQSAREEIDYEGDRTGGRNYGWPIREGTQLNTLSPTSTPAFTPLTDPVHEYDRTVGRSVTGGLVYRGTDLGPTLRGRYFFADYVDERVWSVAVTPAGSTAIFSDLRDHTAQLDAGSLSSFGTDQRGEMYLVSYDTNTVFRVACTFTLTRGVTSFARRGGTGTVRVDSQLACPWRASTSAPWILLNATSGSDGASLTFRVLPNDTGAGRSAVVMVGETPVTISQSAADSSLGDFDGSGTGDVLWQHTDGTVAIWFMRGAQLISGEPFGPGVIPDSRWRLAAAGDIDGDGSRDAIFQHSTDGRLAAWLMSGATMLRGVALTPDRVTDTNWRVRGAGDMNGDGHMDLVWQHQLTGQVAAWLMHGTTLSDGRLLSPALVSDVNWQIVGVADVNRDGHSDLVWHHQTSGDLAVWFMNGTTLTRGVLLSPPQVPDTAWKVRAVADLNGDGYADLIWRNTTDGRIAVWFMREAIQQSGTLLFPATVSDQNWQITGPR